MHHEIPARRGCLEVGAVALQSGIRERLPAHDPQRALRVRAGGRDREHAPAARPEPVRENAVQLSGLRAVQLVHDCERRKYAVRRVDVAREDADAALIASGVDFAPGHRHATLQPRGATNEPARLPENQLGLVPRARRDHALRVRRGHQVMQRDRGDQRALAALLGNQDQSFGGAAEVVREDFPLEVLQHERAAVVEREARAPPLEVVKRRHARPFASQARRRGPRTRPRARPPERHPPAGARAARGRAASPARAPRTRTAPRPRNRDAR